MHAEDWLAIEDYTEISAYYDKPNIYTILRFPLITQPAYNVINVIALPVFSQNNVMTETEIKNEIIALDKEKLTYIKLKGSDLEKCINVNSQYLCTNALPRYRVSANAPCEVQMYTRHYQTSCNVRHTVASETTIWIALKKPHTWLYSTADNQHITISCDGSNENNEIIKRTGKVTLFGKCKMTTKDMTVESKQTIYETDIETYLPQINMSRLYETLTPQNISLENVIQHRAELTELKSKIKQIDGNLENKEQMFFAQKQFVYPMATSGTTILIIIAIIIYIIRRNKREQIAIPIKTYEQDIPPRRPPKPC